jgi:hypothetical protein
MTTAPALQDSGALWRCGEHLAAAAFSSIQVHHIHRAKSTATRYVTIVGTHGVTFSLERAYKTLTPCASGSSERKLTVARVRDKCIHKYSTKNLKKQKKKKREQFEDLDVDGKLTLKRILRKQDVRIWIVYTNFYYYSVDTSLT